MEKIKKILSRIDGLIERNMESGTSDRYINGQNLGFHFAKEVILCEFPELQESEDERIRKWIVNYIHHGAFNEEEHPMALKAIDWLEKQKEQKSLSTEETELNSIAFLEQLGYTCVPPGAEQKPAEWSEEDEKMLRRIIGHLTLFIYANSLYGEDAKECIAWLKSLCSKSSWKPSEKEMQALSWAINYLADIEQGCASTLALLKFNLKELM